MAQPKQGESEEAERSTPRPPPAEGQGEYADRLRINPLIERLTQWLAVFGGLLLIFCIAVTLVSVVGRYGFGAPVPGDYELVELVCAVGVFMFFPYAHATSSNIVVEFFTMKLPEPYKLRLDLLHDVVFTAVSALLTWRLALGLEDKFVTGANTALIRIPFWWSYSFAVISMALLCVVCIARIFAIARALNA